MKNQQKIIIPAILLSSVFFGACGRKIPKAWDTPHGDTATNSPRTNYRPIRLVYLQDLSGSINTNGIEIVTSEIFRPLFEDKSRPIEIYFGVINGMSLQKFPSVMLPLPTCRKPAMPDINKVSSDEQIAVKNAYVSACKQYVTDSIKYEEDRTQRIRSFCIQIDSLLRAGKVNLSSTTDVFTAIKIADRVFNYSVIDSAINILIANTDGLDTYDKTVSKLGNQVDVIVVGANACTKTSIDSITTIRFAFPEQAIQFTLKKYGTCKN